MLLYMLFFVTSVVSTLMVARVFNLRRRRLIDREKVFGVLDKTMIWVSILIILTSFLWEFNFLRFTQAIEHKDWEEIELTDFKGLRRPFTTLEGSSEFAFISSTIEVNQKVGSIEVKSLFHPCRSYVFNRRVYSPGLLDHELTHFHITEYHARLLKKEISNYQTNDIDITQLEKMILLKENDMQKLYDYDTYHGQLNGKQIDWQNKLDSLLDDLKAYKAETIHLPEN